MPDDLKLGVALLSGLHGRGFLARVQEWLPLSRRGGHGAGALFAFAFTFLTAGRRWGIRPFSLTFGATLNGLVAPLLGLRALPTAASISRALGRLGHAEVRPFVDRLLTADPETLALLNSPHVRHRDALGTGWHVLDFDPTVEAFRQRGLPDEASMPAALRLAPGTPGYTGHKRGELRIRHLPLQHAGSSAWLAYRLDATGTSILPLLAELLVVGKGVLDRASPGDIVVRADGEFGSVGAMRTCLSAGVHVLTRLARYALLDREEVKAAMATARWRPVRASGGGPTREAADLGMFTLYPDETAHDADGGPVQVRVVVSRFPRISTPDHGVLREGFQIELFATSLSSDAWPAEHVVALYFGRGAMENRFAQEDREIGIDRTFSYHPPGQEWMSGIGLFLWNLLVGRGVAADPLPEEVPPQVVHEPLAEAHPPTAVPEIVSELVVQAADAASDRTGVVPESAAPPPPVTLVTDDLKSQDERELRRELWSIARSALDTLPLPEGWKIDDECCEVRCPNGQRLFVYAAESEARRTPAGKERNRHRIMLRTEMRVCNGCSFRSGCTSSERANVYKQVTRSITEAEGMRARELLESLKKFGRLDQIRRLTALRAAARPTGEPPPELPRAMLAGLPKLPPGPLVPAAPLFLPAKSRHSVRALLQGMVVEVAVIAARIHPPRRHALLAPSAEARRCQRLTWAERAERWAYGGKAVLCLGGNLGLSALVKEKMANSCAL